MGNQNKTNISIFTTKWGHLSIAEAVKECLYSNLYKVSFNNIPVEKVSEWSYMPIYKFFPQLYGVTFKVSDQKRLTALAMKYLTHKYYKSIEKHIISQKPKVVINTYFAFNPSLEKLSKMYGFIYINIIADPRTFHKVLLTESGYNFVFDQKASGLCMRYGIKPENAIVSGWFTKKIFYAPDKNSNKESRQNSGTALKILIVGGSWGNYQILKTLPAFVSPPKDVEIVFISGDSTTLQKSAELFKNIFRSKKLTFNTMKFTKNLDIHLKNSDVVIGKAGPNLLFEAVAAQKPFIAVSHIHGQEDGNLDIIKESSLGIVEEHPANIVRVLRKILKKPSSLGKYNKSLKKMSEYNQKSEAILNDFISEKLKQSS
jgi:UDP-N-acetylglucosamine:LPS N-acetylglucosamine transferase